MAHLDARLLDRVAYGTIYGTGYKTEVHTLKSGLERRKALWSTPRGQFAVMYKMLKADQHEQVVAAFHACAGRLNTFRLHDRTDDTASNEPIGTGTGAPETYQLSRRLSFAGVSRDLPVLLPNADNFRVFVGGVETSAYTLDPLLGRLTLTAADGAAVTWSGTFDKKVRFDDDDLEFTLEPRAGGVHILLSADVRLQEVLA